MINDIPLRRMNNFYSIRLMQKTMAFDILHQEEIHYELRQFQKNLVIDLSLKKKEKKKTLVTR